MEATGASATRRLVSGWGHGSRSSASVAVVASQHELEQLVGDAATAGIPVLARGLGRSYGDAAQSAGALVLDCTALDGIDTAGLDGGTVRVEAGVSLDALLRVILPRGWFLPVTPGTAQVTVGGAIAADVHGKNHHRDGTFGAFVERVAIVTSSGRVELSPEKDAELFWASVGGMGLTGALAEADIRLTPVTTSRMVVDTVRASDLEACMEVLSERDGAYRHSVAWVDCTARGRHLGRSVVGLGNHAGPGDLPPKQRAGALDDRSPGGFGIPHTAPVSLVRPSAIRAANAAWYASARLHGRGEIQPLRSFFHPLDAVRDWYRLYGPRGFTQYQFVVPFGAEPVIRQALETLQGCGIASSLAVLKRFGAADPAPLSFPIPGWTLALDFPLAVRDLAGALDRLDELVATAGGRVYLAKDGRLRPELFGAMYPRLDEWSAARDRLDPRSTFASDLSRRLGVVRHPGAPGAAPPCG